MIKYLRVSMFFVILVHSLLLTSCNFSSSQDTVYRYALRMPSIQSNSTSLPLIIALHGYGDTNLNYEKNSNLTRLATDNGFIIAYPASRGGGWNAGGSFFTELTGGSNDVSYVLGIIEEIKSNYPINESRIYLTGHSNGAFMVYYLAAMVPDTFAAIAPVAGTMMVSSLESATPTSVLHIHGLADSAVPFYGNSDFPPVETTLSFWKEKNGCALTPPKSVPENMTMYRIWRGDRGDVILCTIPRLGHYWPGTENRRILDFFIEHRLYQTK